MSGMAPFLFIFDLGVVRLISPQPNTRINSVNLDVIVSLEFL